MKIQIIALFALAALTSAQVYHLQPQCNEGLPGLTPYLTQDFQNWLNANGYGSYGFVRTDLPGGSYGGRTSPNQTLVNDPIIFIHGNSDEAIGNGTVTAPWQTGFRDLIAYLQSKGYTEAELYITTWGPANPNDANEQTHSWEYVNYLRQFANAVINYTGASTVNFVAHSMGVTLGRKVIKGGNMTDNGQNYYVGPSLEPMVSSFIALAGANFGLQVCQFLTQYPTCAPANGFYPGTGPGTNGVPTNFGAYLDNVNFDDGQEADFIATLFAYPYDSIIGIQTIYGHNTSQITYQDATQAYNGLSWTHFDIRDGTCSTVLSAIQTHSLSS